MILPAQTIRSLCQGDRPLISPFRERYTANGRSGGLGPAGYDICLDQDITVWEGDMLLASSHEHFDLPNNIVCRIADKSSWIRIGLTVGNTVAEPGWRGWLTLELFYHRTEPAWLDIPAGTPIAQCLFERLEASTELPYEGKYQDQSRGPQPAREA